MKAKDVIQLFRSAKFLARHGDVVLIRDDSVEGDGQKRAPVVAEGEATGHAHRVTKATVQRAQDAIDQMLVRVSRKANLTHEEHDDGALPKGTYRSGIQKQFSPSGWRRVED